MAILEAEQAGSGSAGTHAILSQAGFDVAGSPYEAFIRSYFENH